MIRDVLDRTDLAGLLTELTGEPAAGTVPRWRCCAIDHADEHPSVTMFRDRHGVERWRCWSGGHGGTAIDAVIAARHVTTSEAVRQLEQRAGITPASGPTVRAAAAATTTVAARPPAAAEQRFSAAAADHTRVCAGILWTPTGGQALTWLHDRGLTDRVLRDNLIGYDPGSRVLPRPAGLPQRRGVTYPSFGPDGDLIYLQTRTLDPTAPTKYINPTAAHGRIPTLSIPRQLISPGTGTLVVTEGVPDALIAVTAGHRAVAVLSAGATGPAAADAIVAAAVGDRIVIAFDNDPAGHAGTRRLISHLAGRAAVQVLHLPAGHDLTDAYRTRRPCPATSTPSAVTSRS